MRLRRLFLPLLRRCLLPAALCALQSAPGSAAGQALAGSEATDVVNVLVINGADAYLPAFVTMDSAMRAVVEQRYERPVTFLYETLDALRFGAAAASPLAAELIARKYGKAGIDAVVLVAEPAADLFLDHLKRTWPQLPAVFHSVTSRDAQRRYLDGGLSGVDAQPDYEGTLKAAFALQPKAGRVVVVAGVAPFDQLELARAREALKPYEGRVRVEYLIGVPPPEATERLSRESRETIVLYTAVFRDAQGSVYTPVKVLEDLSAASAAPVYGVFDSMLGRGLAAGSFDPFSRRGARVGELLVRALQAPAPVEALLQPSQATVCMADGRQLERFGLRAGALPNGCQVLYVEPGWFERYWWQSSLVLVALLGQSALIVSLLLQRHRRREAELGLQEQRVQLLHASRLAVAGELTASIAHEINQPLGAILSNADAAQMLVESGQMQRGELLQILADIKRDDRRASEVIKRLRALLARHETERRPVNLNKLIEDTAEVLRTEARRRAVAIEYALGASRDAVIGDPVQIQQVVINLVLNAFDGCAGQPEPERRVRIATSDVPNGVQVSVRDYGAGIAVSDLPHVFDAFFSTKGSGMGLGLSIARSIVDAHRGSISAVSCDVGVEFRVILPLAPTTDGPEQRPGDSP